MIIMRLTRGAISFSSSNHFPPRESSKFVNPVTLPPGRARLSTKPACTGSPTPKKTIGMVLVCWRIAAVTMGLTARIASGDKPISSVA